MANLPSNRPPPWTRHIGIGVNYAAAVAGFGLIGWWIDSKWDSSPWGVLIGAALGLIGATYNLVRETMAAFSRPTKRKPDSTGSTESNDDARP